jgi:hypothetical protein
VGRTGAEALSVLGSKIRGQAAGGTIVATSEHIVAAVDYRQCIRTVWVLFDARGGGERNDGVGALVIHRRGKC